MPANRKLLSIGMPANLATIRLLLDAVDTDRPHDCIVQHKRGQLIIEEPPDAGLMQLADARIEPE